MRNLQARRSGAQVWRAHGSASIYKSSEILSASSWLSVLPPEKTLNSVKYVSEWKPMEEAYATVKAIAVDNAIAERTEHNRNKN